MLKAVIFDLDGTLIDSRQDLTDSIGALLAELGAPQLPTPVVESFIGEGASRLVARSLEAARPGLGARAPELLPRWSELYGERLLRTTRAYDGIDEVLAAPPRARAVLTNKPGRFARAILDGLGLSARLRAVVGGDEAARKPDPRGLLDLCSALGARPSEALLVGDSTVDAETAANASVAFCAVLWGLGAEAALSASRPAHICASPAELLRLLKRLSGDTVT
jgi:phosphoglycolate phosphatase